MNQRQPTRTVAARVAVDLKIFETAAAIERSPKSHQDLASVTGASPILVQRISRACVSMGMLTEHKTGQYVSNGMTIWIIRLRTCASLQTNARLRLKVDQEPKSSGG